MSSLLPGSLEQDVSNTISSVTAVATKAVDQAKADMVTVMPGTNQTPAQAFIAALQDMVKQKPQSAAEAAALYTYIMHKEIYPLLSQLKTVLVANLPKAESDAAAALLAEGQKLEQAVVAKVKGCLPFLNR
jgi:hypothetical protein